MMLGAAVFFVIVLPLYTTTIIYIITTLVFTECVCIKVCVEKLNRHMIVD